MQENPPTPKMTNRTYLSRFDRLIDLKVLIGNANMVMSITMLKPAMTRAPIRYNFCTTFESLAIKVYLSVDTALVWILAANVPVGSDRQALYCTADLRSNKEQGQKDKHRVTRSAKYTVNSRYRI